MTEPDLVSVRTSRTPLDVSMDRTGWCDACGDFDTEPTYMLRAPVYTDQYEYADGQHVEIPRASGARLRLCGHHVRMLRGMLAAEIRHRVRRTPNEHLPSLLSEVRGDA